MKIFSNLYKIIYQLNNVNKNKIIHYNIKINQPQNDKINNFLVY
jgi:hypothetical protein